MPSETTRKHVFVSVGTGGYRAAQTVDRRVSNAGVGERWKFAVIDSGSIPTDEFPRDFEVLQLQKDNRMGQIFNRLKKNGSIKWLSEDLELANQGSVRDPKNGRFYFEYHSHRIYRQLTSTIRSAIDTTQDDELTVWLCASVAGGTGAGMYPLMSVMLDQIVSDISDSVEVDARLLGIACVSELSLPQRTVPGPNPAYYLNSNIVLREMASLLDLDTLQQDMQASYPMEVNMPAAPDPTKVSALRTNTFTCDSPPLDALFVMPVDEERSDASTPGGEETNSYIEGVNYAISSVVVGCTLVDDGIENLFEDVLTERLYTFDTVDVRAPIDDAKRYFDITEQLDQLRETLTEVENRIDSLEQRIQAYQALDEMPVTEEPSPEDVTVVSSRVASAFDRARQRLDAVRLEQGEAATLTSEAKTYASSVSESSAAADDETPQEILAQFVFFTLARSKLRDRIAENDFQSRVEDICEKNADDVDVSLDRVSDAPVQVFEQSLEPYLADSLQAIEARIEDTKSYHFRKRRSLKQSKEELEDVLAELRALRDRYVAQQNAMETLTNQCLADIEEKLTTHVETLEDDLEEQESRQSEIQNRITDREQAIESISETVLDGSYGRIAQLPLNVDALDEVSRETITTASDLTELVEARVIDRQSLVEHLRYALENRLEEPLEDNIERHNHPGETLATISNAQNRQFLSESAVRTTLAGRDIRGRLTIDEVDSPFSITLVTLFDEIRLDNASEYHHITREWQDGSLQDLFGEPVDLDSRIAYPELFASNRSLNASPSKGIAGERPGSGPLVEDGGEQ
ncbi:tubulin-like doman-containing protein [Haloarchaeobius iranensis]|uniref:Tubulin like n=1 Tax=Haloarchaeobius iranensis TaxID=996166 RepID=A0A1H0A2N1_9EURY|nr:Tubulin like [Haloarchaeobius iranensis]